MSQILLVDCYDSFTHTIASYFKILGSSICLIKSDDSRLDELNLSGFSHLVFSPGPGHPKAYPNLLSFIQRHIATKPMLGICLGHQAIAHVLGGKVLSAPRIKHGKTSKIQHHDQGLMQGLKQNFTVMRYHSLVVDWDSCPQDLCIDAWTNEGDKNLIMGFHHHHYPVFGLQYHPESIMSEHGFDVFANFLRVC